MVTTTRERIMNCIHEFTPYLNRRTDWVGPLTTLIAFGIPALTPDFPNFFKIPGDFMHAFFVIASLLSIIWLIYSLIKSFRSKKGGQLLEAIVDSAIIKHEE